MIIDLPATSTGAVSKKLVAIRNDTGAMALTRVLTLVVVTDEAGVDDAIASANLASHQHPCRIVVLVSANRRGAARLDAQIRIGGDAGASEVVVLRMYGELVEHGAAVLLPLLLPDSPVVGWWPTNAPTRTDEDPIGALCQRRITDSAAAAEPFKELRRRAAGFSEGDTDLAWSRITRWRAVLASALDQPPFDAITGGVVTGGIDSPSTDLLAAWLAQELDVPVVRARTPVGSGLISVRLERASGNLDLVRPDGVVATLTHPLQPVRRITMRRRSDAECIADELGRLDHDEVYHDALVKGLPRLRNRTATASELVRKGLAPSPDESRRLVRESGRSRGTSAEMVALRDGEVVALDESAPEPVIARAVAAKAVASASGIEPEGRRTAAVKAEKKVSTASSRAAVERAARAAARRSDDAPDAPADDTGRKPAKRAGTKKAAKEAKAAKATKAAKKASKKS